MELIWTDPKPPTKEIRYNHTTCNTPLGTFLIDWKGWKDNPGYDVMLNDEWIDCKYSLEDAKTCVKDFLIQKHKELSEYV